LIEPMNDSFIAYQHLAKKWFVWQKS